MCELIKNTIDGKQVIIYKNKEDSVPAIYANMYIESGNEILKACKKLGCKPFHLVSISKLRWDEELSPWANEPIVFKNDHFTGEATQYTYCLTQKIIPFVEEKLEQTTPRIIAGYSMGGLFALYTPYITDAFSSVISASGSVWYPDFVAYVKNHEYVKNPNTVYLSLGDLESHTKNRYIKQTENYTKELYSVYQQKGIHAMFEMNAGNHFKDADFRLAKGITWTLG